MSYGLSASPDFSDFANTRLLQFREMVDGRVKRGCAFMKRLSYPFYKGIDGDLEADDLEVSKFVNIVCGNCVGSDISVLDSVARTLPEFSNPIVIYSDVYQSIRQMGGYPELERALILSFLEDCMVVDCNLSVKLQEDGNIILGTLRSIIYDEPDLCTNIKSVQRILSTVLLERGAAVNVGVPVPE